MKSVALGVLALLLSVTVGFAQQTKEQHFKRLHDAIEQQLNDDRLSLKGPYPQLPSSEQVSKSHSILEEDRGREYQGHGLLLAAVRHYYMAMIVSLEDETAGVDVNQPMPKLEITALQGACLFGDVSAVEKLLAVPNIDVDAQNCNNDTALIIASRNGYVKIVQKLLEKGAQPQLRNTQGETAKDVAKDAQIVEEIEKYE